MTPVERVSAVLSGRRPDRPPVSFWHHFPPGEHRGRPAVDAHLRHLRRWNLDFLKVMNDTGFPRPSREFVVQSSRDLAAIPEIAGDEPAFEMELDILGELRKEVGPDVPMIVTVFNAWASLRRLCGPETDVHAPPKVDGDDVKDQVMAAVHREDSAAVRAVLANYGRGLSAFSRAAVEAGADGIFLSVRDDWVPPGVYDADVMPSDLEVLRGAREGTFSALHICGKAVDFGRFTKYPAHVLNWADRYGGPSIAEACKMTDKPLSGGVDNLNTLPNGTPEQVAAEVRDALSQAGDHPVMVTPGCTYDPLAVP
jgi:uroporphyrinogen decarboxylase